MNRRGASRVSPGIVTTAVVVWTIGVALATALVSADNARWGADYFPNVTLTTHEGRVVRFYDDLIRGKTLAIDLIYTTCTFACPLETARLVQVQRVLGDRVGRDIFFYSITIDPEHDTPDVLKAYAETYHVGPGWLFLTGKASDIELISKKLGLYSEPDPSNPDGHTPNLLVGNEPTGQWMRNSALDNPKFLARTIDDWLSSWKSSARKPLPSFADVPVLTFDRGEYTFRNHCAACHTIGGGDAIGPDLKGVTATRDHAWLRRFIASPDQVLADNDPIARMLIDKYKQARMPNLSLTESDAAVLLDYIARAGGDAAAAGSATLIARMPPSPMRDAPPSPQTQRAAVDSTRLIDAYLRIADALSSDRFDGVMQSALAIANETTKIGSRAAAVKVGVNPFAQAADLRAARDAFAGLSDALLAFVRGVDGALPEGLNEAYCPMARKSWIQRGEEIRNPYYGQAMAACGRIVGPLR